MHHPKSQSPRKVTHARVFAIAAPAMVANVTTPLLGIVGTGVIGQLGQAHLLGAVAMSAVIFDFLFWLFGFLRMGTVALTAQALGAGDASEQRAVLARALVLAGLIGTAILLLQWPLAALGYRVMGASPEVTEAARTYFFVRVWSAPFTLANWVAVKTTCAVRIRTEPSGPSVNWLDKSISATPPTMRSARAAAISSANGSSLWRLGRRGSTAIGSTSISSDVRKVVGVAGTTTERGTRRPPST